MLQPNLPKVNIKNGCFEPTRIIEYNKSVEFYIIHEPIKETWVNNSIKLDRVLTELHNGDNILQITGLKVELKEDGLYVSGKDIRHIEDGEYPIGYGFNVKQDEWDIEANTRNILEGTIVSVFIIKEQEE